MATEIAGFDPSRFFLWGHFKTVVYGRSLPRDQADLMQRIEIAKATVTPEMLENCQANIIKRVRLCIENRGGHIEQCL